jgi:trehalose 6-phosphate phosphatase
LVLRAARRKGAARALLLDVDGTLAPIAATPEAAAVPPPTLDALRGLVDGGWTVAPVSGRCLAQVKQMLPIPGLLPFGSHGLEGEAYPGGTAGGVEPLALRQLEAIRQDAWRVVDGFPGIRVESKPSGLAFHDRALFDQSLAVWHGRLDEWLGGFATDGLQVLHGKRVIELRLAGIDKGLVVPLVARRVELTAEDSSFVAIGDDITDEDMFRAIRGLGLAVQVGAGDGPSAATRRLASPDSVGRFLEQLAG